MRQNILFYDVEVFEQDALIVVKDIEDREVIHCWNNRERREAKAEGKPYADLPSGFEPVVDIVKECTLCGYNNYNYDDFILSMMLNNAIADVDLIKKLNDSIISGNGSTIKVDEMIDSIDCMQQIDVSHPSLKQIEGNMGKSIVETSIDFTVTHALEDWERDEVLTYCRYDVESTIAVYNLRKKSYFETKAALIQMLPEESRERAQRYNTTTISAMVLLGDGRSQIWQKYKVPEKYWRNVPGIPDSVWEMWESCESPDNYKIKSKSKSFEAFGCKIVMGLGGLHGAPKNPINVQNVLLADVGSMYPTMIVMMEALGEATEKYNEIRKERLRIKHVDKVRASGQKLLLNSVYGLFKSKYSKLFNPLAGTTVCIYGQIALYKLCVMLDAAGYTIVNINTDGVAFLDNGDPSYEHVCRAWEKEFTADNGVGMLLEIENFDRWIQKDVNNYVATQGDHIKVKGSEVNKYDEDKFFANNNIRIVQIALVEYLLHGTPIINTMCRNLKRPELWQMILKAGGTFQGVQDSSGEFVQKVNRVFASCSDSDYTYLSKVRQDGGLVSFPDVPEKMYMHNGDVHDIQRLEDVVDVEYYIELTKKKLKGWKTCI